MRRSLGATLRRRAREERARKRQGSAAPPSVAEEERTPPPAPVVAKEKKPPTPEPPRAEKPAPSPVAKPKAEPIPTAGAFDWAALIAGTGPLRVEVEGEPLPGPIRLEVERTTVPTGEELLAGVSDELRGDPKALALWLEARRSRNDRITGTGAGPLVVDTERFVEGRLARLRNLLDGGAEKGSERASWLREDAEDIAAELVQCGVRVRATRGPSPLPLRLVVEEGGPVDGPIEIRPGEVVEDTEEFALGFIADLRAFVEGDARDADRTERRRETIETRLEFLSQVLGIRARVEIGKWKDGSDRFPWEEGEE